MQHYNFYRALGGIPLGFGNVVEDTPSELSWRTVHSVGYLVD